MATDSNGNYYFDPNDFEDQQAFAEEVQREQVRNVVKQTKKAAQEQHAVGNLWQETLKEEGIDAQTYEQLYAADPAHAKDLMRAGMKHLATGLKRGRDGKGRFVSQPSGHRETAPAQTRTKQGVQRTAEQAATIDALREKAKTGPLSSSEEEAVIDVLIGKLL